MRFRILAIWLVLCGSAFAANDIQFEGGAAYTGLTLYYTLTVGSGDSEAGETWDGSNYITYTTTRSTFDVAMTEVGVTGRFIGSLPTAAAAINKPIIATVYQDFDDNGTPAHADDIALQITTGWWDGVVLGDAPDPNVLNNTTVAALTSQTVFTLTAGSSVDDAYTGRLIVLYDISNSDFPFVSGISDYVGSTRTVTISSTPSFTVVANDKAKIYTNASDSTLGTIDANVVEVNGDPVVVSDLEDIIAEAGGGPVEQHEVASARTLQARSRGDGTFGVVGNQRVRMLAGETSFWAVEFRGTQAAVNNNLNGMEAPTFTGAGAGNMTVDQYGVDGTAAKFELTLDEAADSDDVINVRLEVHPTVGETIIVVVPVTVGE
jgi:hypothetical protein